MKTYMKSYKMLSTTVLIAALSISLSTPLAQAADSGAETADFRVAPVGAFHAGGASYSMSFSWNPEYRLNHNWSLGANLGWIWFENQGQNNFHSFEFQSVIGYRLNGAPIGFELGVGLQRWTEPRGGTYPLISENIFYEFKQKPYGVIDRVFIGHSSFFLPQSFTQEIKIGLGLSF